MGERAYSLYDIEQFIREAGAEKVTEDAVLNLEKELERLTELVTERAKIYAEHAGRKKLIKRSDVVLARPRGVAYRKPPILSKKASNTNANSISDK
ncbi:MAG: histone-like protein [Candidatus Micrarchaeia archaeon]